MNAFDREISLIGKDSFEKISKSKVIVFGCGGVGGYVIEGLARCGIKEISIVDFDRVSETNINRQIIATYNTIGMKKVDCFKERLLSINPNLIVSTYDLKVDSDTINQIDFKDYDYCVDAIDDVKGKIEIIKKAKENNVKIISCMGTGKKMRPEMFEIKDINQTSVCPLAKKVRHELKTNGISNVMCLFSKEEVIDNDTIGTIVYCPAIAGLMICKYVIEEIIA